MNEDRSKATSVRALEQRTYHAMMEFAPWPMAEMEGATHVLRAMNAAFCALLKKSREELLDKPMAELFVEKHSIHVLLERVLGTGEATSHIETARNTPGPVYWSYTCWPVRAADRLRVGLMIQVTETSALQQQSVDMNEALLISSVQQHELTETADKLNVRLREEIEQRKKAESASERLVAIVEFSDDAIIGKDLNGIITSWNHGAEKIFGYTSNEIVGTSIIRLIPDDRRAEEDLILGKIRLGQSVQHFETLRQAKDGHLLNVAVTASPIKDTTGKVIGASKVVRDITERKRLELALQQTAKDLAEVDRRKSEFLATLAHELRNPLAPLRNGLDLLALSPNDQTTWELAHGMMGRQLDQMVRLIDELMDLSRISRGTVDLRLERVDLRTILEQAAEMSRPLIERQEHTLLLDIPHVPVPMQADEMRLIQVFTNLLNNAAKYTDHGGSIAVRAEVGEVEVTVLVEDNGIGIAPDQLARVFDMFAQVERANDRVQGGLGIGLNIVKHLVGMHGGRISVASEGLGKGSSFSVVLPLVIGAEAKAPAMDPAMKTSAITRRRILIVDDNEDAANMMALLLGRSGHEVHVAHNGQQALEEGEQMLPQLILMDLGMPVMDGYAACRAIRRTSWGTTLPIVALSGWGQPEDRIRTKEAGFDEHLVKPITGAALLATVASLEERERGS